MRILSCTRAQDSQHGPAELGEELNDRGAAASAAGLLDSLHAEGSGVTLAMHEHLGARALSQAHVRIHAFSASCEMEGRL